MPHLILYNPPSSASRKPVLPMSLLALGQVLEGEFEYSIVDGNLVGDTVGALVQAIRATGADILAVTVMPGPQLLDAVPTCREIKKRFPDLTIVWGGYFPSQHFDVCLKAEYVDYVVRGHGEFSFRALVRALRAGDRTPYVPGLAYRETSEAVTDLGTAPIPHPRELPDLFPYHKVDLQRYLRNTFLGKRTLPHHSSYGCPFFCNFCAVVNMVNGGWKAQTVEQVANVAQYLVKTFGVDALEFDDNNFFTAEARVAEFCERIIGMGLEIGWWGEARIDTMMKYSDRTWALMRDAGLRMVFLGAESGSDETLARMNKGGTASAEKTLEIAKKMQRYGIVPEMSFVLGNPPEPEKDAQDTIAFIRKVKGVNPATEIIMYMYTPVPLAGELYEQAKAEGFAFPETLEAWISPAWQEFSQRRSTHVPWLKDPIQRQIQDFQWVLNAYYPTMTDVTMSRFKRTALRTVAAWRYHLGVYALPYELKAVHRVLAYQRPETSGF
ncbi:MAG: cobalamin B12-binding domain-containing protein [Anaerolineales bacterium]|nr:cobalamin B12-binding domain-containing protein [Anaerolineales bacterium]